MCQSCDVLSINGIPCHETGCPDTWRDAVRECRECGSEFAPESSWQQECDESCHAAYNGYPCELDGYDPDDDEPPTN